MPDNLDFSRLIAHTDEVRQLKAGDWVFEIGDGAEELYVVKSGAVEILAEGGKGRLQELTEHLKMGPPGAEVAKLETSWSDYTGKYPRFSIRY